MGRRLGLLALGVVLTSGCAYTHPRMVDGFAERAPRLREIAVLNPSLDVEVKYIDTNRTLTSPELVADCQNRFTAALGQALREVRYPYTLVYEHKVPDRGKKDGERLTTRLKRLKDDLTSVSELILLQDPGYAQELLPSYHVSEVPELPPLASEADVVLFVWGEAVLETGKETALRLTKNVLVNLALLPLSVASSFVPLAMPLTINLTTGFYESSMDMVWIRAALVDVKTGEVLFHNDYFQEGTALFLEDVWDDVAEGLLEDLPERPDPDDEEAAAGDRLARGAQ